MPLPAPANIAAKFLGYLLDKDEMPSADLVFIDGNHGGCGVWVGLFWGVGWGVLLFFRVCVLAVHVCGMFGWSSRLVKAREREDCAKL